MPAAGERIGDALVIAGLGEVIGEGLIIGLGDGRGLGEGVAPFPGSLFVVGELAGVGPGLAPADFVPAFELAPDEDDDAAGFSFAGFDLLVPEFPGLALPGPAVDFGVLLRELPIVLAPRSACRSIVPELAEGEAGGAGPAASPILRTLGRLADSFKFEA
jgi:hypothetical protein